MFNKKPANILSKKKLNIRTILKIRKNLLQSEQTKTLFVLLEAKLFKSLTNTF